jgi:chorismate mutase
MTEPVTELNDDEVVNEIREEIAAVDRALVEVINRRVALVQRMRARKEEIGAGWVDPAREQRMLDYVAGLNAGPVSQDGLAELYRQVVALCKRDVYGV